MENQRPCWCDQLDTDHSPIAPITTTRFSRREYFAFYAPLRSAQHALDIIAREAAGTRAGTLAVEESARIEIAITRLADGGRA